MACDVHAYKGHPRTAVRPPRVLPNSASVSDSELPTDCNSGSDSVYGSCSDSGSDSGSLFLADFGSGSDFDSYSDSIPDFMRKVKLFNHMAIAL